MLWVVHWRRNDREYTILDGETTGLLASDPGWMPGNIYILMGDGVNIAARIEALAKPGAICLSEDAYRQIKSRLDLAVNDLGERQLKNIAEPIRLYSLEVGKPALVKSSERVRPSTSPGAPRLSIVVLPFANLGGDPQQEHFVDGVTESLTTDLSRLSGATVIARNTAFTYKGKHIDVKQIGRDLNIRYVLEGSVQRGGDRLRINVRLSMLKLVLISGPSASTSPLLICSICRTRLSHGWQMH
jgi:TolB-like protein